MNLNELINVLSYPFMTRAIIVGILVSLCASLLGVILVLKRYSLIGHGLSDVGFASLSLAISSLHRHSNCHYCVLCHYVCQSK